jgi:hypothetical protein
MFRADAGKAPLASIEQDLNRLFVGDSVEQIFEFLEMDSSDWGKAQLAILKTKSPQTLKVAFRSWSCGSGRPTSPTTWRWSTGSARASCAVTTSSRASAP